MTSKSHEALLVGPSESYHLGDLLRPHILTRLLNFSKLRCAGVVSSDLTGVGGHSVRNYGESVLDMRGSDLQIVHYGGDTLSKGIVEGYEEAIGEEEAERFHSLSAISGEAELKNYVRRRSGQVDDLSHVLAAEGAFLGAGLSFHAVGMSEPEKIDDAVSDRLLEVLRSARFVGIRDERGAEFLESKGIDVQRMPCGLTVLPQVCSRQLREHRDSDAMESIRSRFPSGWIAVGVSEIQDQHFDRLTEALESVSENEGVGIVFFDEKKREAGALSSRMRRWVNAFPDSAAAGFNSENIWEVASMLLHSRLYCGSSLSSRIICMSGGVGRINVPTGSPEVMSYCELWEHDSVPIEFSMDEEWEVGLNEAMDVDLSMLQEHSTTLHRHYFESFAKFCAETGMSARLIPGQPETAHARAAAATHHLHDEWLSDEKSLKLFRKLNGRRKSVGKGSLESFLSEPNDKQAC
ncbi:polysaccharide pyruvyl transferase family protein [Verrucomicrobiales bacterium]|nr:polysaccharide pyruvyl transferase family protein [Verrucomicrobiales bacterium]